MGVGQVGAVVTVRRVSGEGDGDGDGDPPLVLVHGLGATSRSFDRLRAELPADRALLTVDLPGGAPVDDEAAALAAELTGQGVRSATLVGHSRGGLVAVAVARIAPQTVGRLVLIDAPPSTAARLTARGRQESLLGVPVLGRVLWAAAPRAALRRGLASAVAPGTAVPDVLVDDLAATSHGAFVGASRGLDRFLARAPLRERLAALAREHPVPVLVVVGARDQRVDPAALVALADVDGVRVEQLPGIGHSPAWEAPRVVADLLGDGR